jgi:transposase
MKHDKENAPEHRQGKILELVKRKKMTLKKASKELGKSYSQAKRMYSRYLEGGDEALVHKGRGRRSNHAGDERVIAEAQRLCEEKYRDFGPTLAQEKLRETDGIDLSVSTVRRIMISAGLWEASKNGVEYRSRRTPRPRFGELIQFDGSHHKWFEERGPKCCLMTMIDDATKNRLSQFFDEETMFGAMAVLKRWILAYGIPESLYCDHKNAFVLTREATDAELLAGILKPKSHFGKACDRLGIEVIAANSPQAKGRVERNHGVDQDRLVKELRLAGISTMSEGNRFLLDYYLPKMNEKFSRPAASDCDAHVPLGSVNLDDILCMEFERIVSNDWIVRYDARLFQILDRNRRKPRPKDKVTLRVRLDNSIHVLWQGRPLLIEELPTLFD